MIPYLQPLKPMSRLATALSHIAIIGLICLGFNGCGGSGAGSTVYLGATIFDGTGAPPIYDAALLVSDGRIEAIGPEGEVRVPRGAQELRIDGMWIIPGLIDAHVHAANWTLSRFLSYGVTSVRSMGGDQEAMIALRDSVLIGSLLGPRMYISGAMIDGSSPTWPSATSVRSASEGRSAVDDRVLIDAAQVKIYTKIDRNLLAAIADEAQALQIPIAAHLGKVDAVTAAQMGVSSIEHMTGVVEATLANPSRLFSAHDNFFYGWKRTTRSWATLDSSALAGTAQSLAETGASIVPTLVLYETFAHLADADYVSGLDLSGVPQSVSDDWDVPDLIRRAQLTQSDYVVFRRARPIQDLFVKLFRDQNGNVAAGTDTPNQLIAPGASIHDELAFLVAAGLSTEDALLAATRNAARVIGVDSIGVLIPGNVADFVVLTADPLEDINNTRALDRIVYKGVSYHPAEFKLDW